MEPAHRVITILQGHPDPDSRHFCHALAGAYADGAREGGHAVEVIDVARLEFPLARSRTDLDERPAPPAIQAVQRTLLRSDHVVLIFPVWNGAMPALLKGFLEQIFRSAFVFPDVRPGEKLGFTSYFSRRKALSGKTARIIATMAMPAFVYRWYFHPHPEKNTLKVGGLSPVRETLIGRMDMPDAQRRERWLRTVRLLGRQAR